MKRTRVSSAFPDVGKKMLFLFDYGDEWRCTVELIARTPRVAGSRGKAPPQYRYEDDEYDYPVH